MKVHFNADSQVDIRKRTFLKKDSRTGPSLSESVDPRHKTILRGEK